jgi:hypothetical protein
MGTDPSQLLAYIAQAPGLAGQSVFDGANNALAMRQGRQQIDVNDQNMQINRVKMAALTQAQQKEKQYQSDLGDYFHDPKPEKLAQLAAKYPEQADGLKQAYTMMDTAQRTSRQGQFGSLLNAATNGRADLVKRQLTDIRAAEVAQGIDPSEVDDALALLESDPKAALKTVSGFAQMHLAAIDPPKFADTLNALGKGQEGFTLSQGQSRFDANGQPIASLAPKPDYLVVPEGGKAIPINGAPPLAEGGGQSSGGAGGGSGAPRSVRNNNPGNLRVSAFTKKLPGYQGADDAGYAIFSDPGAGQNAQAALIKSYMSRGFNTVSKIIERWAPRASRGGDNTEAQTSNYAAYVARKLNVNPNDTLTPVVADRLAAAMAEFESGHTGGAGAVRMGGGQTAQAGDPPGTLYGKPKAGYQIIPPNEVPKGLDPNTVYQRGPDGNITPVGGQRQGQLKAWPQPALAARSDNTASIRNIDNALSLLDPKNNSPAAKAAKEAVGFGTGGFGLWDANRTDPKGAAFRALIGQIGGVTIKEISGAAVSAAEDERLKKWIPYATDSGATIRAKLNNLRREIAQRNAVMDGTYNEDQGYRPFAAHGGGAAPVRVRSIQQAQRLPKGTVYVAPDGKVRRR